MYSTYVISPPRRSGKVHCYLFNEAQLGEWQECTTADQIEGLAAHTPSKIMENDEAAPGDETRKLLFQDSSGAELQFVDLSSQE